MKYRFGDKLRAVRERRSLTLKDVAEKAGISESMVSQDREEQGFPRHRHPSLDRRGTGYRFRTSVFGLPDGTRGPDRAPPASAPLSRGPGSSTSDWPNSRGSCRASTGSRHTRSNWSPGRKRETTNTGTGGSELGLVMEGKAQLSVGTSLYTLECGDSASFASDFPHILAQMRGTDTLRVFWVITPPKNEMTTTRS